jgi:hypothetical protein
MLFYIAIGLIVLWIALIALVWTKGGLRKGRKFGNRIAKHLGLTNNLFHSILDNGTTGPSLQVLAMLENSNCTLHQASVELAPSLERGLVALEHRFGRQEMIENAKPIVIELLREWDDLQQHHAES